LKRLRRAQNRTRPPAVELRMSGEAFPAPRR
jgi:hypothetical protein